VANIHPRCGHCYHGMFKRDREATHLSYVIKPGPNGSVYVDWHPVCSEHINPHADNFELHRVTDGTEETTNPGRPIGRLE